jgi:hypothetical protein
MCESAREARRAGCGCLVGQRRHVRMLVCLVVAAILQEGARRVASSPSLRTAVLAVGVLAVLGVVVVVVVRTRFRWGDQGFEPVPSAFDRELAALYEAEARGVDGADERLSVHLLEDEALEGGQR